MPNVKLLCISEEKYHFTPDAFKSATRSQRTSATNTSIAHLLSDSEIVSTDNFSKAAIIGTQQGKIVASTFIPRNVHKLSVNKSLKLIFDSELHLHDCHCKEANCKCEKYTTPLLCYFSENGLQKTELMESIKQTKGEAECAQVDWVVGLASSVEPGDVILSLVSSADIDAVVLHIFAVAIHFPRGEDDKFKNKVYVMLQKSGGHFDLYNITGIIESLEQAFKSQDVGPVLALALCLGGNDFLPKFQMISHLKIVQHFMGNAKFRKNLFTLSEKSGVFINSALYKDFMKRIYCPLSLDADSLTYEEVRQLSIKPTTTSKKRKEVVTFTFTDGQVDLRQPKLWLPPGACLEKLTTLYNAMVTYMLGLGKHDSKLPDFSITCLIQSGKRIVYDLGSAAEVKSMKELLPIEEEVLQVQKTVARSKKRTLEMTPRKCPTAKRRPVDTSTPIKKVYPLPSSQDK
jgi:hypothetical protein